MESKIIRSRLEYSIIMRYNIRINVVQFVFKLDYSYLETRN